MSTNAHWDSHPAERKGTRLAVRCALAALLTLMATQIVRAAEQPPSVKTHQELLREEDRIDRLPVAEQAGEYLRLRSRLLQTGGDDVRHVLDRLAAKLALANDRLRAPNPAYDEMTSQCRQIDAIGAMHLSRGHTQRALWWESVCRSIEPEGKYAGVLHNRIHQWYEDRLDEKIAGQDWRGARGVLAEWQDLMGAERAVAEGLAAYATARAGELRDELLKEGARQALRQLLEEEQIHSTSDAWSGVRVAAAAALQAPFDSAVVEHRADDAAKLLEEMNDIAETYALSEILSAREDNHTKLNELIELLKPEPFRRAFGHVRHPTFRMELGMLAARSEFASQGERVDDQSNGWSLDLTYRQRGIAPGLWHGAHLRGSLISAEDGLSSGTALVAALHYIAGRIGERHSAHLGIGATYIELDFTGLAASDSGSGIVYGSLSAGLDYALSESFLMHAEIDIAASDVLRHFAARAGIRYHTDQSFAIGLAVSAGSVAAEDESAGSDIEMTTAAVGLSALVQF